MGLSGDTVERSVVFRRPWLDQLLACPYCLGFWVSAAVYLAWGGWSYGRRGMGEPAEEAMRRRLTAVEVAVKHQDNREHYAYQFHWIDLAVTPSSPANALAIRRSSDPSVPTRASAVGSDRTTH